MSAQLVYTAIEAQLTGVLNNDTLCEVEEGVERENMFQQELSIASRDAVHYCLWGMSAVFCH